MMPRLGAVEVPIGVAAATAVARSQFEDLGAAALSQCAAEAIVAAIAATGIGATASVRRRSVLLRSVRLPREPITAVAAVSTVTAIGFAHNTDTNAKGRAAV